jgi:hypothetical protein
MRGTGRCPVTAIAARAQGDSLCAIAGIAAGLTKSVPVPSVPSVPLSAGGGWVMFSVGFSASVPAVAEHNPPEPPSSPGTTHRVSCERSNDSEKY